ncbi:hypothetical protein N800_07185, partial [Lysobacter daejeonensis GH1-9]
MLIRALIVLLLVLNLGVAAWWFWSPPTSPERAVDLPPNVARLQLVRERDADVTTRPAAPRAVTAGAVAATPVPSATAAPAAVAPAGDAPVGTPERTSPVTVANTPAPSGDTPRCYSYGPFDSEDTLVAAQATLKPLTEALVVRRIPLRSGRGWRVYLPPLANAEEATAAAGRILAAGFRDYFIVREGAEANSVALGRFGSEAAARRHAEALNAAGFAVRAEQLGAGTGSAWV